MLNVLLQDVYIVRNSYPQRASKEIRSNVKFLHSSDLDIFRGPISVLVLYKKITIVLQCKHFEQCCTCSISNTCIWNMYLKYTNVFCIWNIVIVFPVLQNRVHIIRTLCAWAGDVARSGKHCQLPLAIRQKASVHCLHVGRRCNWQQCNTNTV